MRIRFYMKVSPAHLVPTLRAGTAAGYSASCDDAERLICIPTRSVNAVKLSRKFPSPGGMG